MKLSVILLAALAASPVLAWSQGSPAASVNCADEKDDTVRLKCYDWQAARQRAAAATARQSAAAAVPAAHGVGAAPASSAVNTNAAVPSSPASVAATAAPRAGAAAAQPTPVATAALRASLLHDSPSDPAYGLSGEALRKVEERGAPPAAAGVKQKPQPLVATVASVKERPDNHYTVVLDNGQVWEQTDSRSDFRIAANDPISIKPGILGSFFLTNVAQRLSIRVRRVQ